ncbi:hypothetical protein E2C01_065754 [Portunus trituberculatus]|uniref:Uncharacterized protein n=1 Tax=Portunus trituberculatus TaxID=210409 RepID=A0A5B7HNF5_PORTR|nr:hypothetical protein [Portunus trituberculatus]
MLTVFHFVTCEKEKSTEERPSHVSQGEEERDEKGSRSWDGALNRILLKLVPGMYGLLQQSGANLVNREARDRELGIASIPRGREGVAGRAEGSLRGGG